MAVLPPSEEGVLALLLADGRLRAVARHDLRGLVEGEQLALDGEEERAPVAAPEVTPPDAPAEEGVAGEDHGPVGHLEEERHAPGRVPRGVQDAELDRAGHHRGAV